MNRFATIAAALGLVVASSQLALAEKPDPLVIAPAATTAQVSAGSVLSAKELGRAGLSASDTVTVTKIGLGAPVSMSASDRR